MSAPPPSREASLALRSILSGAALGAGLLVGASVLARFSQSRRAARSLASRTALLSSSEVIILGCGSSTGVPRAACVTEHPIQCETCARAMQGPPETNRNWRGNPSLLIRYVHPRSVGDDPSTPPRHSNIQIDVCKTFLPAVLRWFPYYGVRTLDSVLITHEHSDACLGLDDIRSLQRYVLDEQGKPITPPRLPVHVSSHTFATMKQKFNYLIPKGAEEAAAEAAAANVVDRKVAQIDWPLMRPFLPFVTEGLEVLPLPVLHGEDYVSLSFLFGTGLGKQDGKQACLYMSDVSRIPQPTWDFLCTGKLPTPPAATVAGTDSIETTSAASAASAASFYERFNSPASYALPSSSPSEWKILPAQPVHPGEGAPRIELLVIDALFPKLVHNTHFNLQQALQFIQRLHPRKALLTGMSDLFLYERDNAELKRRRASGELTVDVELAYDGLRFPINL
jgi:phosphoribosyl 1,2-cyclic phosphodiesterase